MTGICLLGADDTWSPKVVETPDNFDGLLNVTRCENEEVLSITVLGDSICLESVPISHIEDPRKMLHGAGREKTGLTVCNMSRPSPFKGILSRERTLAEHSSSQSHYKIKDLFGILENAYSSQFITKQSETHTE